MSLYGTALIASIFIIALLVSDLFYFSESYSKTLYVQELYRNIMSAESIGAMVAGTIPNAQNASQFGSWLSAINSAAVIDGFQLQRFNNTILISSDRGPKVYSTIDLN